MFPFERAIERATGLFTEGDRPGARSLCRELIAQDRDYAPAIRLIALDDACNGEIPAAVVGLTRALALQPDPVWYRDLASALGYLDRWTEAREAAQQAVALDGGSAESLALSARCLLNCGDAQQALAALAECVRIYPQDDAAQESIAAIHRNLKRFDDEVASRRAVVALRPGDPTALARLGMALYETGDLDACVNSFEEALRIAPHERYVHSNLLCAQVHRSGETAPALIRQHRAWARVHCSSDGPVSHRNSPDPDRPLRVGYLTGECILNPTIFFFLPILKRHDAQLFETYCYHARQASDSYTDLYKNAAHNWRDVSQLSTSSVAEAIRADGIDILVDVSGHFPFGSLPVFALRPAPVQVSNANYPCTTGLSAMDYILTDEWTCPLGHEGMYTETPVRVPSGYFAWEPQVESPLQPELPALANGSVTFCLLQRPPKINGPVLDALAGILCQAPDSQLLIHQGSRDLDNLDGSTAQRYIRELGARGVDRSRLRFQGGVPLDRHLKLLSTADIALDTFPYSGQTTTCESLYMGIPVVTLTGDTHASRVSASILHRSGCGDCVVDTIPGYVNKAVHLANDLPALARKRSLLRSRFLSSPVCDPGLVTRDIEHAFREMWWKWCAPNRIRTGAADKRSR